MHSEEHHAQVVSSPLEEANRGLPVRLERKERHVMDDDLKYVDPMEIDRDLAEAGDAMAVDDNDDADVDELDDTDSGCDDGTPGDGEMGVEVKGELLVSHDKMKEDETDKGETDGGETVGGEIDGGETEEGEIEEGETDGKENDLAREENDKDLGKQKQRDSSNEPESDRKRRTTERGEQVDQHDDRPSNSDAEQENIKMGTDTQAADVPVQYSTISTSDSNRTHNGVVDPFCDAIERYVLAQSSTSIALIQ